MTVEREPGTIEDAVYKVFGAVGLKRCAAILEKEDDYVRSFSHPGSRYRITVEDAIRLDLAFEAAGGAGAPILDTYQQLYDCARAKTFADAAALTKVAIDAMREGGQAEVALVIAAQPGATDEQKKVAVREVKEALAAFSEALPLLIKDAPALPP